MKNYIEDELSNLSVVYDDIEGADCIGDPVKEIVLRYLKGRRDGLEGVLGYLEEQEQANVGDAPEKSPVVDTVKRRATELRAGLIALREIVGQNFNNNKNKKLDEQIELLDSWREAIEEFLVDFENMF